MKTTAPALADNSSSSADHFIGLIETAICLSVITVLIKEHDIPIEGRALRIRQYSECAEGIYDPESVFDPVACCLLSIALRPRTSNVGNGAAASVAPCQTSFGKFEKKKLVYPLSLYLTESEL